MAITIDMSFMGETSCMVDMRRICGKLGFNSYEAAIFLGTLTFLFTTCMVGLLMMTAQFILEIKVRVEKIQECLQATLSRQEQVSDIGTLPVYDEAFFIDNEQKVYKQTIINFLFPNYILIRITISEDLLTTLL